MIGKTYQFGANASPVFLLIADLQSGNLAIHIFFLFKNFTFCVQVHNLMNHL